jgi:hypothetical protein
LSAIIGGLLAAAMTLVAMAGPLAAAAPGEIVEESWPCGVARGAILAVPDYWAEANGEPYTPMAVYFTAKGLAPETAPPATDFAATIDWGDGTTSPASVVTGSVGDCYNVDAIGHTYTAAGNYVISYTVRDLSSGEELAIVQHEVHIWANEPELIGDPASRVISPTTGVAWTGAVAEFAYAGSAFPWLYTAEIEWAPGTPPVPAIVNVLSPKNAIAVTGSVTYATEFNGTVRVLLYYSKRLLGTWAASNVVMSKQQPTPVEGPTPLRFVGKPLLARVARAGRHSEDVVLFRLSNRLPVSSSGHPLASVKVNGHRRPYGGSALRRLRQDWSAPRA